MGTDLIYYIRIPLIINRASVHGKVFYVFGNKNY